MEREMIGARVSSERRHYLLCFETQACTIRNYFPHLRHKVLYDASREIVFQD